jgi:ribosomal protein L7/L12
VYDAEEFKKIHTLMQQVAELDRKVTFLAGHLGVTFPETEPPPSEIEKLILGGDRIEAIKLYRMTYGADLRMAKEAVEEMAARLGV